LELEPGAVTREIMQIVRQGPLTYLLLLNGIGGCAVDLSSIKNFSLKINLEISKNKLNLRSLFVICICGYDSPYPPEPRLFVDIEL
jgi:hypothetical protein